MCGLCGYFVCGLGRFVACGLCDILLVDCAGILFVDSVDSETLEFGPNDFFVLIHGL